jgi:DNA-binding LytR/AlgR family response regulator
MNILIIEDEPAAARRLAKLLPAVDPAIKVTAAIDSVEDAIEWFRENDPPDLGFVDVELADGTCFEIFDHIDPGCPLIFVTAYDEYAIRAFKLNSIDYLLKPVDPKELKQAMEKFQRHGKPAEGTSSNLTALLEHLDAGKKAYKSRFLVKTRDAYYTVSCGDLSYILIEDQLVYLVTRDGKHHPVDSSLDELEKVLDPTQFHRINRQMMVHADAVRSVSKWFNSRLILELSPAHSEEVVVSREKVSGFKKWLDA